MIEVSQPTTRRLVVIDLVGIHGLRKLTFGILGEERLQREADK
jgi:hypothetical protein